ncbi:vacuolar protein 8-like [Senna tora]|uniref:Vacuolar protein 8-like n=1 Tax=Senna tora TaxID=362788 RepID=A0A834SFR1_9FABA|nr:vacuolar protein 8-like [Senna tora]
MGDEEGSRVARIDQSSPGSFAGDSTLRRAVELITSLISLSHSVRVFAAKWQLIRSKLEELHSGLIAAESCDSGEDPSLSGLVPAILATVNDCYDLARRCVDLSYSGKLLMQSDLDAMFTKFDRHVKKLSEVYTTGILTHKYALVVSRPSLGACKDDMRFYMRDLLTRTKIGDVEMKRQALINLHESVMEDEKYVKVIVEMGDIIHVLVNFLDSPEMEIQEESAKVISVIAGFDSYRGVLITSGIIAPLIRILECGSESGKVASARCLMKLTFNSDNAWSVSAHGGVTSLLKICANGESEGELVGPACGVLRNLVAVEEIKRFMVEEGAVSTFIRLVRSKDEAIQVNSIQFIQSIASGDELVRQMVIREGGVRALLRIMDPKWSYSSKTREIAMRAIENLCFSSSSSVSLLMNYGFVDQLLYYIRNGEVSIQELALKVTFRFCGTSEEARKAMGDAGFMPELVKFLSAKSFEVREMAAEALSAMVLVPKNRKKFVQDDQNISLLLQLLDPEEGNSGHKKFLISILMSLTSCNSGRKKIVSSGYAKNIEKLAEAEVSSDAKRLVRKLSTNRFRMRSPNLLHLLNRNALSLRKEEVDEKGHHQHKEAKENEEPKLHMAKHGEKYLCNHKCEEHICSHRHTLSRRSDLQWKNLTRHQPPQGTPRPSKTHHINTNKSHHHYGIPHRQRPRIPINPKLNPNSNCNYNLTYKHLNSTFKKQGPPTPLINSINGHSSSQHIDEAGNNSRHQCCIGLKSNGIKQNRCIEHYDINASELLEEWDHDGHCEMGSVLSLKQVLPRVFDLLRCLTCRDKIIEFCIDLFHSSDFLQLLSGFLVVASCDHGIGSAISDKYSGTDWLQNPIPKPSKMRPKINIQTYWEKALIKAPARKTRPPKSMEILRPNLRVIVEATKLDNSAARYKDDVNEVNT